MVLAIWGTIGYKIVTGLSSDEPMVQTNNLDVAFTPKPIKESDTFSIQTMERDPFLGTLSKTNKPKTKSGNQNKPTKETKRIAHLSITYQGLIKKQGSSQQVYVVNLNGKQYLIKQGQTVEDVKLVKGNPKEITIRFNNQNQTIALQE